MSTRFLVVLAAAAALLLPPPAVATSQTPSETTPRKPEAETKPRSGQEPETPRFHSTVEVEAELTARPPQGGVATRLPVAATELPLSVEVVPRPLLDEQHALVMGDALRNVSGVNVATGFGVFDFFVIRGFDSLSGGLVLTDGVPEPESSFYPLYNVQQVEVLKGPASFLHGGNPLSGAVQLTRKEPQARRFADVTLGYGRFGSFETALDANVATDDGRLAARLNAAYQGSDGYRDLPDGSISAVHPSLVWRPDGRTRLGLDFEFARSRWPPDTGIPFVGDAGTTLAPVPRTRSYQTPYDASSQDVYRVRFEAERRLGDAVTLRNRLYYTELTWDSDGSLVNGAFPGPDGRLLVARTLVLLEDRQRLLGDQLELAATFATGAVGHELLLGVELRSLKDRFTQDVAFLPPVDLLEPLETARPPFAPFPPLGQAGDSRALVLAPYVVDRLRFSSKLQAFVGARFDTLDYEDPPNATERKDDSLNPLLGLVFSPTRDLSLHASWGTASAPPSTQVVGPRDPEKSRQWELGAKLGFLGGKGHVNLAAYQLERDGIAIPDSTGITQQAGDQRSRGLELDMSLEPVAGWVSYLTYAFTDAELTRFSELLPLQQPPGFVVIDRSGNRAPFAPRHLFTLWTTKRLGAGLSLGLGLRSLSEQYVAEDNRYAIAGYTTLDATVAYELRRLRLRLHLRNLTGTEYETRGFGSVSAIPSRPFEAALRAEIGFGRR